jgi:methylglutaconyl-CoA hydratase
MINGHALAGGCGLVNACDFAFAVPEAKLGYTEVRIGFVPALVSVLLTRKLGEAKASELLLSGEIILAEQALKIGLINKVIPAEQLLEECSTYIEGLIKQNSGQAMAQTKQLLQAAYGLNLEAGLDLAAKHNAKARSTSDCKEGIAAFLEKRSPRWSQ